MLVHLDNVQFRHKPKGPDIGGVKSRMTDLASIRDVTVQELAAALARGQTVQPGVTPFSGKSRAAGRKGTVKEDFACQTVFMVDVDNANKELPFETPAHVAETLFEHRLKAAFMYETFGSTEVYIRFRFAVVCDEDITDRTERDRIQKALVALFPQSDAGCVNADRMFYGTDKGLLDTFTDFGAVCKKADLLRLADNMEKYGQRKLQSMQNYGFAGLPISPGCRHNELIRYASVVLKRYGNSEDAVKAFLKRVDQCTLPMPPEEVDQIWKDACRHYATTIASDPAYVPPEKYVPPTVLPADCTDVGQACVFISQYGSRLRYSAATKWLVYDGKKWNESELQAQKFAQELTDRQLQDAREKLHNARAALAAAEASGGDEDKTAAQKNLRKAMQYRAYVLERRSSGRIAATLTEARPAVEIDVRELDKDGFLLNTPDGTVDLKTGEMREHDPKDYCTKMTAVSPSDDGKDEWTAFLDKLTSGDKALQTYLQICSGMEAVGNVFVEKLTVAYGRGGNGKSTFYNAKSRVLGDYAGSLSAETLTVNCRKNRSPEYAELRGKRLVIAAELEEGMRLDTAVVKKLCSTDPIQAEKKYKDPFSFLPSHSTVLYTNHLPRVGTTDTGTWDRLVVVPFTANFRGQADEVMNYGEHLAAHCGGAILKWIIDGAKMFIRSGYHIPEPDCVKEAVQDYRQDNDWLTNFLDDMCDVDPAYTQRAGEVYDAYRQWCEDKREWTRNKADFKAALTGKGFEWQKTKKGAVYHGFSLLSDTQDMPF